MISKVRIVPQQDFIVLIKTWRMSKKVTQIASLKGLQDCKTVKVLTLKMRMKVRIEVRQDSKAVMLKIYRVRMAVSSLQHKLKKRSKS